MSRDELDAAHRVSFAKQSYVTRHVRLDLATSLKQPEILCQGDIVLAKVKRVRQHTRLELPSGRRAHLFENDELILAAGRRYATDQFMAELPAIGAAHLVASGGVAARVIKRHSAIKPATEIEVIGALCDAAGAVMNLRQYAPLRQVRCPSNLSVQPVCLLVLGTGMNSGKTTMVTSIVRSLKESGQKVMACKLTGTGSGNDLWQYSDAGADFAFDFTDAGLSGTWQEDPATLLTIATNFIRQARNCKIEYLVVELADGILQQETNRLLQTERFRSLFDGYFVAANCSASAVLAARTLSALPTQVVAIGGRFSQSPLYVQEVLTQTGLAVLDKEQLAAPAILNSHLGPLGVAA